MGASELGRLKPAHLREAWAHEAHDFTPWLAANLTCLGDVLGIELEAEGTEVGMGSHRADIVARDPSNDRRVLIENQLEDADLQHLGQVLAYLAGLEAQTVIWIARHFGKAHLSAIRWLNDHTSDPFSFFAVRVGVVQIGDSPLAPVFEVLEQPNDWERSLREAAHGGELSELGQFRREFWAHVSARALGGEAVSSHGHTLLRIDTSDRTNWDRMAEWLHERRLNYERVLRANAP